MVYSVPVSIPTVGRGYLYKPAPLDLLERGAAERQMKKWTDDDRV